MPTVLSGLVSTDDIQADERIVDMSEKIRMVQPSETALYTTITNKLGAKPATREKVQWLEDEYRPRVSALAASAASADTAFTVTSGDGTKVFKVGDIVRIMSTNEAFQVTSVSANSVGVSTTAQRGLGGSTAASAANAAKLMVIGNASAQGAGSGTAMVVQRASAFNYTQIQRDDFSFTETETHINLYTGGEPEYELAKKAIEHKRAIENTLFFGARDYLTGTSPKATGYCGGALEFISTNVTATTGGALTPAAVDTFLEGPFGFGSMNKALFCAPRVATVLSQMYRGLWAPPNGGDQVYGVHVNAWFNSTYGGTIPVFVKREWADLDVGASNYGTWAFLLDMDNIRFRPLQGRNTHVRRNIQEPSADAETHEYLTEFSLEFAVEKSHGILKNVTSYSAT